jgi:glucokinase
MLLAGDIGGTKTILGVYAEDGGPRRPLALRVYPSAKYPALDAIVGEFLATVHLPVERACFDVAGPVDGGRATLTNLPWPPLDERALAGALGLRQVWLLNDLEAIALGITELHPRDLRTLQRCRPRPGGPIAVVAPGTGLGEAFLTWEGGRYVPHASEGGHRDFAPSDERETDLLRHLRERHGHVSYELVCSGIGIPNLYEFLASAGFATEAEPLATRIASAPDRTRAIVEAGMDARSGSALCAETLRMFVAILGAEAGNLALTVLASGGIYLAGGIPPAVLPLLRSGPFLDRLRTKGRLSRLVAAMPVYVVLGRAALVGAATAGLRRAGDQAAAAR